MECREFEEMTGTVRLKNERNTVSASYALAGLSLPLFWNVHLGVAKRH